MGELRWSRRKWFPPGELPHLPLTVLDQLLAEEGLEPPKVGEEAAFFTRWAKEPMPLLALNGQIKWEALAQAVNPAVEWTTRSLWTAGETMLHLDPKSTLPKQVTDGLPTPEHPKRRGLVFWYAALVARGWRLPHNAGVSTIMSATQALVEPPAVTLARILTGADVVSLRLRQLGATGPVVVTSEGLPDLPTCLPVARMRAAQTYQISLVDAEAPIISYAQLVSRQASVADYPSLVDQFDHRLPPDAYSETMLARLAQIEGTAANYASLKKVSQAPSFMLGWWSSEGKTSVDWVPRTQHRALSYGVIGSDVVTLTYDEWLALFRDASDVIHPRTRAALPATCLAKLARLADRHVELKPLAAQVRELLALRDVADRTVMGALADPAALNELAHYQDLGMAMRGWVRGQPYPTGDIPGTPQSLALVEELLGQSVSVEGQLQGRLMKLPLYLWRETQYVTPRSDDGVTIGERLLRVRAGRACIRIASNCLLASVARYGAICGWTPGFDVRRLPHVA